MDRWRAALENLALWMPQMRIEARNTCPLGQVIEMLTSSAISIPYIFVSATSALLSTVSIYDHPSFRGAPWLDFCNRAVQDQSHLWYYINILQFATPEKDDTLRAFLAAMRNHLKQEWLYIFGDAEIQQIDEMLRSLDVHTPISKVRPGTSIPGMTPRYWTNVLSLRKWSTQLEFNDDAYVDPGLQEYTVESEARAPGRFYMSPVIYRGITAGERTEGFINCAYPGAMLAVSIWFTILENPALSKTSRQFLNNHVPCLKETLEMTNELLIPSYLGLRSALKLGHVPDWHLATIRSRSFGPISRSKVFYLWFYRQSMCIDLIDGFITLTEANSVAELLRHTSDFSHAFDCKLTKHSETCLIE
ncbi:unnamed protein product [Ixodes hexagonus]